MTERDAFAQSGRTLLEMLRERGGDPAETIAVIGEELGVTFEMPAKLLEAIGGLLMVELIPTVLNVPEGLHEELVVLLSQEMPRGKRRLEIDKLPPVMQDYFRKISGVLEPLVFEAMLAGAVIGRDKEKQS